MAKVTIATISEVTGLSRGTVSRALNNRPDISAATRERVLDACKQLNYVPSIKARTLATGRNFAIAALLDANADAFARAVLHGASRRAAEQNYVLHFAALEGGDAERRAQITSALSDRVDAALWIGAPRPTERELLRERTAGYPLALTTADEAAPPSDRFTPDEAEAGRLLAQHLLKSSSGAVVFVQSATGHAARRTGFLEIARRMGRDPRVVTLPANASGGRAGWTDLAAQIAETDVIAADTDETALAVALFAAERGRVAGRDYQLGGIGNLSLAAQIAPTLTTVDLGGVEIGQRAVDLLLQRIEGARQDAPTQTLVAPRLIVRTTT